jgi:hypothetical protein
MPSPFPGMDPYMEDTNIFSDLHTTLIVHVKEALNRALPPRYMARTDRYVWIHEPTGDERCVLGEPDVYAADLASTGGVAGALAAPATARLPVIRRQGRRYLKILDAKQQRVVTVVEILSPSNKGGEDREASQLKRNEYLGLGINLVEIDLLRSGTRSPLGKPPPPAAPYYVLVSRAVDFPEVGIWPISLRQPLPDIPVPLYPGDVPIGLPLQACFTAAYDAGKYSREIDYSAPPNPPLEEPDATWARELLITYLAQRN